MEKLVSAVNKPQEIQQAYEVSMEPIERLQQEIASAKVCMPIIGKFSSGKSALVNTALGYRRKILQEDITPETAIPAEIVYTDAEDCITIFSKDGVRENIPVDAYRNYKADANTVKCARIQLRNSFLAEIPDVMLVDMPGFESGFEVHNKAIDNYLVEGVHTTLPFGKFVMEHEAFRSGDFDTGFVKAYYDAEKLKSKLDTEAEIAAMIAFQQYVEDQKVLRLPN